MSVAIQDPLFDPLFPFCCHCAIHCLTKFLDHSFTLQIKTLVKTMLRRRGL